MRPIARMSANGSTAIVERLTRSHGTMRATTVKMRISARPAAVVGSASGVGTSTTIASVRITITAASDSCHSQTDRLRGLAFTASARTVVVSGALIRRAYRRAVGGCGEARRGIRGIPCANLAVRSRVPGVFVAVAPAQWST
ncbi:hypothetical protein [Microbacterium paulum]